jgi:hypothetical protein
MPLSWPVKLEVLDHLHFRIKGRCFGQVPDAFLDLHGVFDHVKTGDISGTRGWRQEAGEHAHRGGLAGAIGAEKTDDLPFFDLEGDVVDSDSTSVSLGESLDFYHMLCPGSEQMTDVISDACRRLPEESPIRFIIE